MIATADCTAVINDKSKCRVPKTNATNDAGPKTFNMTLTASLKFSIVTIGLFLASHKKVLPTRMIKTSVIKNMDPTRNIIENAIAALFLRYQVFTS